MKNILIFRIGSIGDTVVVMPAFRKIAEYFPYSKISVLTNFPSAHSKRECPLSSIIEGTGLVTEYIEYPIRKINCITLWNLRKKIHSINPDTLIYLMPIRTFWQLLRDWCFFKICGIRKIIGLNFHKSYQSRQYDSETQLWEHEGARLCRLINEIGNVDLDNPKSWNIALLDFEKETAKKHLESMRHPFFAFNVGTKQSSKDWGESRWIELTFILSTLYDHYGLVLIGSEDDFSRSQKISEIWKGSTLNLCGKLSPRVSAAVLEKAKIFIGHDSGPMHLAAAVGTPVVAIFSAQNKPGEWYPFGKQNQVIYHKTDCFGCRLVHCKFEVNRCIQSISVDEVIEAVKTLASS